VHVLLERRVVWFEDHQERRHLLYSSVPPPRPDCRNPFGWFWLASS